jgi:ribosomal 50S subunit-recycling heat shock protein
MRIDLLLKYLCLVKSRSLAKILCDKGAVRIFERPVRPSSQVKEGDHITLETHRGTLIVEIHQLPNKQLSRVLAPTYYRRVAWAPRSDPDADFWEDGS